MKPIKNVIIFLVVALLIWLAVINGLKIFPRDSAIREIADPIVDTVYEIFSGKKVTYYDSPEQEKNLKACFNKSPENTPRPEQCSAVAKCLNTIEEEFEKRKISYKNLGIHRLTKMSIGWQMEFIFTGAEDGERSSQVIAHLLCTANKDQIVTIKRL